MNSVERVKMILKGRGIAVSKLEKDLGFSNGYIAQLKRGSFPADRLEKIRLRGFFVVPQRFAASKTYKHLLNVLLFLDKDLIYIKEKNGTKMAR